MLSKKQIKRNQLIQEQHLQKDDSELFDKIKKKDKYAYQQAQLLCKMSDTHVYQNTTSQYYDMGEAMFPALLEDLKRAEKFIFMEYFIIEEGHFWNSILEVLKEKAVNGVEVRVLYDDIGCMMTLPGDYYKTLQSYGIKSVSFARLRGQANNEFNNRSHRKITVIDGYEPGFVHAKVYLSDDKYGIVGTSNLDYRSLVHNFENNVWLYQHNVLTQIKDDMKNTMEISIAVDENTVKDNLVQSLVRAVVRVLAPLL